MPHRISAAWEDPVVQELTSAQQAAMRLRCDGDAEPGVTPSAGDVAVVLVDRDGDGTPVGCGTLRPRAPGAAELERRYVVPAARGRGISRLLLVALAAEAVARGGTTLRLETGTRQPAAVGHRPVRASGHHVTLSSARDIS